MSHGEKLVKVMKQAAQKANPDTNNTDVLYGVVQAVNPLTVVVENRLILTEEFLILSPFCYEAAFDIEVASHSHDISISNISKEAHTHDLNSKELTDSTTTEENKTGEAGEFDIQPEITCGKASESAIHVTLWNDLGVGEKLVMLRVAKGQAYMILYRDKLDINVS